MTEVTHQPPEDGVRAELDTDQQACASSGATKCISADARREPARSIVILSVLFAAVLILTNPLGDFPLNDDWSYGQAVQNLVWHREYRLTNWTSMPLLTQVLWGALFSVPTGFSFTVLRMSTLTLSLAALLLLLLLTQSRHGQHPFLLLGPLLLLFNPVFLALSHTFMTDVPFMAIALASILLLARGVEREEGLLLGMGMCMAVLATLLRQTGMLIPLAFGVSYASRGRVTARSIAFPAAFLILTVASYLLYTAWLSATGRIPAGYSGQWNQIRAILESGPSGIAGQAIRSLLVTFVYLSIFTLPFGVLFISRTHLKRLLLLLVISATLLGTAQICGITLPGNILSDRGVGPFTLKHSPNFAVFLGGGATEVVLGILALLGGALLLEMLACSLKNARSSMTGIMCLSMAGLCLLALSLVSQFDRYTVFYLPMLLGAASLALRDQPPRKVLFTVSLAAIGAYAAFSVSAVHDYMLWNRVRWQAIRYVTDSLEVPAERLDGGFEFNGLYTYSEDYVRTPRRSWWWVKDDQYVIAFDLLPGYRPLRSFVVGTWLPAGIKQLHVLVRADWQPYSSHSLDFEMQHSKLGRAHGALLRDGRRFRGPNSHRRNAA
jgi:4-amino-4-deoxy-L-arabinose transferase-like glycosyltransferase